MSSIQKLVYHWKQGQFIPGGKPPQPLNNEVKGERLSELNGNDMIVPEITKGISILKDVVEALKTTQEFNKDPSSFSGDARDVLMSDDFLLVADVLRLIFPEGMISDVWQLKRGRDEDLDTRDDAYAPRNRQILIPMPKRLRFTNGPEAQENKTQRLRFTNGPESQPEKKPGLFSMPASQIRFTNGSESQPEKKPGLFSMPASQIRFTNGSESQPEKKPGLFGVPASQLRFTNGSESQPEATRHTNIFRAKDKDSNNSPALQRNGIFSAKEPAPEYRGIFSQQIGFASNPVVSKGLEKVSDTPPTPPRTGGIFSTTSPGPEHTESSGQYIGSLSGNNKEVTLDKLLSSMGGEDVNKILAQLQLHQQGIKRKHEEEKEIINKKQKNIQEPHSLIEL